MNTMSIKTNKRRGTSILWSSRYISLLICWAFMGQLNYFCTDYLGLDAAIVGVLFLIAKIFDAISNFIVAYIVDNCHFKKGKGRPWEIAIIPLWLSVILLFAIPAEWGAIAKYAMIFTCYVLNNAVFATILCCVDAIYLRHAFTDEKERVSMQTICGGLAMLGSMLTGIALPMLVAHFEQIENGWAMLGLLFGVPCEIFGSLRFLFIPEVDIGVQHENAHISIKDTIFALIFNKYALLVALAKLVIAIVSAFGSSSSNYYFTYIVGDLSLASVVNTIGLVAIIILPFCVPLANKFGRKNVLFVCFLIAAGGCLLKFFAGANMTLLTIAEVLIKVVNYPVLAYFNVMMIDCMEYGEWKNGKQVEGAIFAATGLGDTIGNGLGSALCGIVMSAFGYNGAAAVQTSLAITGIRFSCTLVPAIALVIVAVIFHFYDLETRLPKIREELKQRKQHSEVCLNMEQ